MLRLSKLLERWLRGITSVTSPPKNHHLKSPQQPQHHHNHQSPTTPSKVEARKSPTSNHQFVRKAWEFTFCSTRSLEIGWFWLCYLSTWIHHLGGWQLWRVGLEGFRVHIGGGECLDWEETNVVKIGEIMWYIVPDHGSSCWNDSSNGMSEWVLA